MTNEEDELRFLSGIRAAVHDGPPSTPEARRRVMEAVRAAGATPNVAVRRSGWRSPAFGLVAAASIAGIIALVRAHGISYVPDPVPGIDAPAARVATPALARPVGASGVAGEVSVQFVLVAPNARRVSVVGDFNDWNPAATALESAGGVWSVQTVVAAGRHDYAFVIDGSRWLADPAAPRAPADELGGGYSVLIAGATP